MHSPRAPTNPAAMDSAFAVLMRAVTSGREPTDDEVARIGRITIAAFASCVDSGFPRIGRRMGIQETAGRFKFQQRDYYLQRALFAAPGASFAEQSATVFEFITENRNRLAAWHRRGAAGYALPEYQRFVLQAFAVKGELPGEKQLRRLDINPRRNVQGSLACSGLDHERG
jgi:hypothetical protein